MTDFPFISRISFKRKLSSSFKIIRSFVEVDQNIYKNAELRQNCVSKALRFLKMTAEHQDCPPYTEVPAINSNFANIEAAIAEESSRERFWKNSSQCRDI